MDIICHRTETLFLKIITVSQLWGRLNFRPDRCAHEPRTKSEALTAFKWW